MFLGADPRSLGAYTMFLRSSRSSVFSRGVYFVSRSVISVLSERIMFLGAYTLCSSERNLCVPRSVIYVSRCVISVSRSACYVSRSSRSSVFSRSACYVPRSRTSVSRSVVTPTRENLRFAPKGASSRAEIFRSEQIRGFSERGLCSSEQIRGFSEQNSVRRSAGLCFSAQVRCLSEQIRCLSEQY